MRSIPCEPETDFREPEVEPAGPKPAPKRYWLYLYRLVLSLILVAIVAVFSSYFKLTRIIDQRLAKGPFSSSTNIMAAPRTLLLGEPLVLGDLVQILKQNGYTNSVNSPSGWFHQRVAAVEIFPGTQAIESAGPVRISLTGGKLASIVTLDGGRELQQYRLNPPLLANLSQSRERRRLVRYSSIPPSLVHALISAEDKHFFQHGGFDFGRILKAAYIDVKDGRKREGASTLTMQLSRSLWLDRGKSWKRKLAEFLITTHLEHKLTKQQIFEYYANEIYLGQRGTYSINGFGEGARVVFGKDLSQIDTAEAALLAGMVRGPSYYNPLLNPERARQRRNVVLSLMYRNGYLKESEYRAAAAEPIRVVPESAGDWENSYFLGMLNNELRSRFGDEPARNRSVYTTLDLQLQQAAEASVRSGMDLVDAQLRKRQGGKVGDARPQVALIALDPRTGEIKALIGGRDYSTSQLNHALAMRQPGSVFKPFVYAAALATAVEGGNQVFTPASLLNDEPTTFADGAQTYEPKDFHAEFAGDVTMRTALAHSLNVATVSLAEQVGYKRVVAMARRAGLNDSIRPTPSVALGAYEATPLEIAGAYTMFANHGTIVRPTTISMVRSQDGASVYTHQPEQHKVLDPRVAYLMVSMMEEVLRSGTGAGVRSRGFTQPAAGKTGTSRDGWFAGFTDELLCVVWVGFDDNRDLDLEGARSALPIWAAFMQRASQLRRYGAVHYFERPAGVVSVSICADTGELAGPQCPKVRDEVFIAGTEPTVECSALDHGVIADGTIDRSLR